MATIRMFPHVGDEITYSFDVTGGITGIGRSVEEHWTTGWHETFPNHGPGDTSVEGSMGGGMKAYEYTGEIQNFQISDPTNVTITIDGLLWIPPGGPTEVPVPTPDKTVDIILDASSSGLEYSFQYEGNLVTTRTVEPGTTVTETRVSGSVGLDKDSFRLTGFVRQASIPDAVDVYVEGVLVEDIQQIVTPSDEPTVTASIPSLSCTGVSIETNVSTAQYTAEADIYGVLEDGSTTTTTFAADYSGNQELTPSGIMSKSPTSGSSFLDHAFKAVRVNMGGETKAQASQDATQCVSPPNDGDDGDGGNGGDGNGGDGDNGGITAAEAGAGLIMLALASEDEGN